MAIRVVKERLNCLTSKIAGKAAVRRVGYGDVVRHLMGLARFRKRRLMAQAAVAAEGPLLRVTLEGCTVYWPGKAPLIRLIDTYDETFSPTNPHQFERFGTPVRAGDVVLDCGACEGYFVKKCLERCSRAYLIEPSPLMQQCLQKTFEKDLRSGRAELVGAFVSDHDGEVMFVENPEDPLLGRLLQPGETQPLAVSVPMRRIDTLVRERRIERVDYIKADVEGAELQMIRGAEETIRRWRPRIAITTYHDPGHAERLIEMICGFDKTYRFRVKGIVSFDGVARPVMAHFWAA